MKTYKELCLPLIASLALSLGYLGGTAHAQLTAAGSVSGIPAPSAAANASSTSLRYDASGNLYAWDGISVWELNSSGGTFNNKGSVSSGTNSADAGPITLSQDGSSLLLGNGAGGYPTLGNSNGAFWTMPTAGGVATRVSGSGAPYTGDAIALPAVSGISQSSTKYLVDEGDSSFTSSSLSIFDTATGTNKVVVSGIPGASTSVAFNPKNNTVCASVGYGTYQGDIYGFSLAAIANAYNSGNPILWTAASQFAPAATTYVSSGSGMFFDNNGYLFSGGDGITVYNSTGSMVYNGPAPSGYAALTYDPVNNEVLEVPYGSSTGTLYNATAFEPVPEPSTFALLGGGALLALAAWRRRRRIQAELNR